jgi:hypothetical protein
MATFKGAELVCQVCGAKFKVPACRAKTATTCSHKCSVVYRAQGLMREKVEVQCKTCGITKLVHKSYAATQYCSIECRNKHPDFKAASAQPGAKNGMWRGGIAQHSDGYLYEHCPDHPFASNGYVLQHRLVAERHLRETNPASKCLVKIGDNLYLDPELVVHHKNFDRTDNVIDNLQVMTNSDHQALHNRLRAKPKIDF